MAKGEDSLATLGTITRIVILIFIVSSLAFAVMNGVILYYTQAIMADTITPDSTMMLGILGLGSGAFSLFSLGAMLGSFLLVALWVYRAWANLHTASLEGLNYTPGWATASFFIPFVNMLVPMKALRELHNRSHGESDWHAAISVGDVTSWYACTWAAFVVGFVTTGYLAVDAVPGLHVILPEFAILGLGILLLIFVVGSAYFLSRVIAGVTNAQKQMLHYAQSEVFE